MSTYLYTNLSPEERMQILADRIKAVEIEHYIASVNLKEIEGTEGYGSNEELMSVRQDLARKISHSQIRLRNLHELLGDG